MTWIEQLATKKRALGLDGTIAVSSKGFSKTAYLKAKHHGVTPNTYQQLKLALTTSPLQIAHRRRSWASVELAYELADESLPLADELQEHVNGAIAAAGLDKPLIRVLPTGQTASARQLIEHALATSDKHQQDGTARRMFKVGFVRPTTLVALPDSVTLISLMLTVDVSMSTLDTKSPIIGQYSGPDGPLLQVATLTVKLNDQPADLNIYFKSLEIEDPSTRPADA